MASCTALAGTRTLSAMSFSEASVLRWVPENAAPWQTTSSMRRRPQGVSSRVCIPRTQHGWRIVALEQSVSGAGLGSTPMARPKPRPLPCPRQWDGAARKAIAMRAAISLSLNREGLGPRDAMTTSTACCAFMLSRRDTSPNGGPQTRCWRCRGKTSAQIGGKTQCVSLPARAGSEPRPRAMQRLIGRCITPGLSASLSEAGRNSRKLPPLRPA